MGPPPPRNPNSSSSDTGTSKDASTSVTMKVPMGPPPPKKPDTPKFDTDIDIDGGTQKIASTDTTSPDEPQSDNSKIEVTEFEEKALESSKPKPTSGESINVPVPYTIPPWSERPCHPFFVEVLKDGSIIDQFDV